MSNMMVAEDLRTWKAKKMKENARMSNGMVAEDLKTILKAKKMKENARMSNMMVAEDLRTVKIIHRQTESAKNPATEDLRKMKIQAKAKQKKKTTNHEFNCDVVCLAKRLVHLHLA